jgi:hypothetical protein
MDDEIKACVNCKYFRPRHQDQMVLDGCSHPESARKEKDYITGKVTTSYRRCVFMREESNRCGPAGKWYVSAFESDAPPPQKKWYDFILGK